MFSVNKHYKKAVDLRCFIELIGYLEAKLTDTHNVFPSQHRPYCRHPLPRQ